MPKMMQTIVWDVDDVLNNLMRSWFEQSWLPLYPHCLLQYEDLVKNPPHHLLEVGKSDYLASLDEFRLSGAFEQLKPVAEVLTWFQTFGDGFRHIALTATPFATAPISAAWVMRHFGQWIRCFSFVPSPREGQNLPLYDNTKGEFLAWWDKADIFVDDSIANVEAAKSLGIKGILIPQPWNNSKLTLNESLELLISSQGI